MKRKYIHNRPTIGVLAGWQYLLGLLTAFLGMYFEDPGRGT